jgi:parvulin-like peptidyl-prolyl isomerase
MPILLPPLVAWLLLASAHDLAVSPKVVDMYVRNGVAELGLDRSTAEGRATIARLEQAVRDELRDRTLIEAEAVRRKLPIAAHLAERTRRWVSRLGGEAAYRAYLAEHDLTEREFARVIEQEIASDLLREALTRDIRVTDAEIAAFYRRERATPRFADLFIAPATVSARHILIAARQGMHTDLAARRARAEELHIRLQRGEDFAVLARQHSEDPGTRARGGDLGTFTRDRHTAAFDEAAFALAPGQTSPVIQTEYGFHIIRVTAAAPERIRTLAELRPAIEARLTAQKSAEQLRVWLEQRRAETSTLSLLTEKR